MAARSPKREVSSVPTASRRVSSDACRPDWIAPSHPFLSHAVVTGATPGSSSNLAVPVLSSSNELPNLVLGQKRDRRVRARQGGRDSEFIVRPGDLLWISLSHCALPIIIEPGTANELERPECRTLEGAQKVHRSRARSAQVSFSWGILTWYCRSHARHLIIDILEDGPRALLLG